MIVAQISDTHIAAGNKKTFGVAPMAENLIRCVSHINALKPNPDLLLLTGDITNDGALEEAQRAATILAQVKIPYYIVPGNHDDREVLNSVFGHQVCPLNADGFMQYEINGYDLRLIAMDSLSLMAPGGEICPKRLAWLEERLAQSDKRPVMIFLHHPPAKFSVPETDIDGFIGADQLGDLLMKHDQVERIICGHIHLPALTSWKNILVSTAPSIGMRLTIDLTLEKDSQFIIEDPSYHLHYWTPDKTLITHTMVVAEEKEYPFSYSETANETTRKQL